jgi:hypothetical protein
MVIIALVCNGRILIQSALHAPSEVDSLGMYNPLVSGFSRGNWKVETNNMFLRLILKTTT